MDTSDENKYVNMASCKDVPNADDGATDDDTLSSFDGHLATEEPLPSKYLYDRCAGRSVQGVFKARPRCFMCIPPMLVYSKRSIFEQNRFCHRIGACGIKSFQENESKRTRYFRIGIFVNLICFALTVFSCLSISQDFDIIRLAPFSHGELTMKANDEYLYDGEIYVDIGLTAAAVGYDGNSGENDDGAYSYIPEDHVLLFSQFCEKMQGLQNYLNQTSCSSCQDISEGLVSATITSAITVIPTIATDVLRMYVNYDVNCQKFMGCVVATISFLSSLFTLLAYRQYCFLGFYNGPVTLYTQDENGDDMEVEANFAWWGGAGLRALLAATCLKTVDIALNAIIPTPRMVRSVKLQKAYEKVSTSEVGGDYEVSKATYT